MATETLLTWRGKGDLEEWCHHSLRLGILWLHVTCGSISDWPIFLIYLVLISHRAVRSIGQTTLSTGVNPYEDLYYLKYAFTTNKEEVLLIISII